MPYQRDFSLNYLGTEVDAYAKSKVPIQSNIMIEELRELEVIGVYEEKKGAKEYPPLLSFT